jgi:hypothetical protein
MGTKLCYYCPMETKTTRLLVGLSSLLAIYPATNYQKFVPLQSAAERMNSHWERTGTHLKNAITQYAQANPRHARSATV